MRPWMILGALAVGAPALAQEGDTADWADKSGAVGIGGDSSLGGTSGITIRTYVSPAVGLQATLGFGLVSTNVDPTVLDDDRYKTSNLAVEIGLYGTYKLAYWQRGHLSLLFGGDLVADSRSVNADIDARDTSSSNTDVLIGLGLQGEYFPTQYLSLYLQGGLRLDLIGDDEFVGLSSGSSGTDGSVAGTGIDLGASILGAGGFTVWFK